MPIRVLARFWAHTGSPISMLVQPKPNRILGTPCWPLPTGSGRAALVQDGLIRERLAATAVLMARMLGYRSAIYGMGRSEPWLNFQGASLNGTRLAHIVLCAFLRPPANLIHNPTMGLQP
jgi:hypothetical protein